MQGSDDRDAFVLVLPVPGDKVFDVVLDKDHSDDGLQCLAASATAC
jgi:hypothetical protein